MLLSGSMKGFLLVFLPLVVNLFWIGLFWNSAHHSAVYVQAARKESNMTQLLSRLIVNTNRTALSMYEAFGTSADSALKSNAEQQAKDLQATIQQLREASQSDRQLRASVDRFSIRASLVIDQLRSMVTIPAHGFFDFAESDISASFGEALLETSYSLKLLNEHNDNFNHNLDSERANRQRTNIILLTGLLSNLAVTVALAAGIQLKLVRRVSELSEKARNFTNERIDYTPIAASDEIAELDSELLIARKQWLESQRFRKVFMVMVARHFRKALLKCGEAATVISRQEHSPQKDSEKRVKMLSASVSSCLNLIDDILLLANSDGGALAINPERSNIKSVVVAAVELVSSLAASKKVTLENQCQDIELSIDKALMKQVLVNLISNAIKFAPPNTPITIKSEQVANNVRISVCDLGPGMSEEVRNRVFQKFYQSAEGKSVGGTGLGLAIAQMITLAHKGTIGVESEPGKGSVFYVEVPV